MNATIITAGNNASIVASTGIHSSINAFTVIITTTGSTGTKQCTILFLVQKPGLASEVFSFTYLYIYIYGACIDGSIIPPRHLRCTEIHSRYPQV